MRKFLIAFIMLIILSSASYGASEDIYVRQDVFDAKMEALFARLDAKIGELRTEMKNEISGLRGEIAELKVSNGEIKGDIKALDARVSNIENNVSWWIGGLTLFLTGLALVPLIWTIIEKLRKPLFTLEDVRKLIEENNVKQAAMYAAAAK